MYELHGESKLPTRDTQNEEKKRNIEPDTPFRKRREYHPSATEGLSPIQSEKKGGQAGNKGSHPKVRDKRITIGDSNTGFTRRSTVLLKLPSPLGPQ